MNIKLGKVNCKDAESWTRTRVYFFIKNESILENLMERRSRPYNEYRKLLPEVLKRAGIKDTKASWSQKAGCSCGCSPGFVLDNHCGKDVFVDITVKV